MRQTETIQNDQNSMPGLTPERGQKVFQRLYKPYPNLADTRTYDIEEWEEIGQGGYAVVFAVRTAVHGNLKWSTGEQSRETMVIKLYYPNGKQHPPEYYAKKVARIFKVLKENEDLRYLTWDTLYWDGHCQLLMTPGFQEGQTVLTYLPQSQAAKDFKKKITSEPSVLEDIRSQMERIAITAANAHLTVKADAYFFLVKKFEHGGIEIKVILGDLDNVEQSQNWSSKECLKHNMKKAATALKEFTRNYVSG